MPMPYSVSPQRRAILYAADVEADHELFAFHAARLGDQKVTELVNENDRPQANRDLECYGQEPRKAGPRQGRN